LDREECLGTVYRAEGWTEGEPIRTEAQANAAFIARAMECHDDLLAACKAQHEAIDILFAMLIARSPAGGTFYPSKSGQPWEAMKAGHAAIAKAGAS
jgi:phosphoketolase